MLRKNMNVKQICRTKEWNSLCRGYDWLLSVRNSDGGWRSPEWTASDAATTGHVLRVLVEMHPAGEEIMDAAAKFLVKTCISNKSVLEWPAKTDQLVWDSQKPSFEASLCAILALLRYSSVREEKLLKDFRIALETSGKKWVLRCLDNQQEVWKYGLWWLFACAAILSHISDAERIWQLIRSECEKRLCEDGSHWQKAPDVREDVTHTINVLQCLSQFPQPDLPSIIKGTKYLLNQGIWTCEKKQFHWTVNRTKQRTGPLLATRYALWLLTEIRDIAPEQVDIDSLDVKIFGAANWLAKKCYRNGYWKEPKDKKPSPSISAYAILAIWRSICLACCEEARDNLKFNLKRIIDMKTVTNESRVFISFVSENKRKVKKLKDTLEKKGIKTWTNEEIPAGSDWQLEILQAIRNGQSFAACFSSQMINKQSTYMRTELEIAEAELSRRPQDQSWFIPIKLNKCEIPYRRIGTTRTLQDLQWVELYKNWDKGIEKIIDAILSSKKKVG
jgi:hypothetical protein